MVFDIKKHQPYSKQDFEKVLLSMSPFLRFNDSRLKHDYYKSDWIIENGNWIKKHTDIQEYCYFLPLNYDYCIKVYSSVNRSTDTSRAVDTDAIRVVAASTLDAKPVRPRFTRINRTANWKTNLKKRISEIISSLGIDTKCPECRSVLFLKRNSITGKRFFGCSTFKSKTEGCQYSRDFNLKL